MPPNTVDGTFDNELDGYPDERRKAVAALPEAYSGRYFLQLIQAILNLFAYLLVGMVVGICVLFCFKDGAPIGPFYQHILLCVTGYQLLMAVAILSLTSDSGFSASLTLRDKRRIHTVLQVIGSGLAIAGSFIMSLQKNVNFDTLHGKFALVAMVLTTVSLVNGLTSIYAYELRKCLPSNLSKLTHICFGTVAFAMSTVSLCYGFDKTSFRLWATDDFVIVLIVFAATYSFICIINPSITFFSKINNIVKN